MRGPCDVTLVCDLRSPACSPFVIKSLIEKRGVRVYAFNALHAKVYLSDEAICVASANLSACALKIGSLEAGVILQDAESIRRASDWFGRLHTCSEDAGPIIWSKQTFATLVANWRAHDRPTNGATRPSLLTALLQDNPFLRDYVFCFYIDAWEHTDAEVRRKGREKGIELPPAKVWQRYEDDYSRDLQRHIQREMRVEGKKSIAFEVIEENDVFSEILELDSEAGIFVNQFRFGSQLVTNMLREPRPPFHLTGKDAPLLCRKLTAGLRKHPELAEELSNRLGWFATSTDLQRLLARLSATPA